MTSNYNALTAIFEAKVMRSLLLSLLRRAAGQTQISLQNEKFFFFRNFPFPLRCSRWIRKLYWLLVNFIPKFQKQFFFSFVSIVHVYFSTNEFSDELDSLFGDWKKGVFFANVISQIQSAVIFSNSSNLFLSFVFLIIKYPRNFLSHGEFFIVQFPPGEF